MTKKKTVEKENEEVVKAPDTLSDVRYPSIDEDGNATEVGIDIVAAEALDAFDLVDSAVASYATDLDATEGVLVHTFYKLMSDRAKEGIASIRDRLLELAGSGKVDTEFGQLVGSAVKDSVQRLYTDKTMEVLEEAGILSSAVNMSAVMREGIDVEAITDEEMEVLEKYFDIDLLPDTDKIEGLIALGKIPRDAIEATIEETTTRKGGSRLSVKPSESLLEFFAN